MGRSVLVTRAVDDFAATAELLAVRGFEPIAAPLLRIVLRAPKLPAVVHAVLVTSGHALPALPPTLHATPLFAVGDATADRARLVGFADVHSAAGDAGDLAALVLSRVSGTALLATGAGQGGALSACLRRGGLGVVRRVVYEARPVARLPATAVAALGSGELHGIIFMSAATAQSFVGAIPRPLYPALGTVIAACISEQAATMLRPLPWRQVRVSLRPTLHHVLALL